MESFNLTKLLGAKKDNYARKLGDFILTGETIHLDSIAMVFEFLLMNPNAQMRIIYVCKDGKVRDMIGRQGVHASQQDGEVQGTGHAMRDMDRMNISFHTHTFGGKAVNTGAGKGYRTVRAAGIVAIHADGKNVITENGAWLIRSSL